MWENSHPSNFHINIPVTIPIATPTARTPQTTGRTSKFGTPTFHLLFSLSQVIVQPAQPAVEILNLRGQGR